MPATPPIELKRHFRTLSEKETDEVVDAVADLIVNFLKAKREPEPSGERRQERTHERSDAQQLETR